jgi:serine/threonine-protein kinase HipA
MYKIARVLYGDQLAGILSETDDGYSFVYDEGYLRAEGKPVSLTLPLTSGTYASKVLFPFFDGLIPEGWLLDIATDYWKVNPRDRFALLLATCKDAIGAVSIIPES